MNEGVGHRGQDGEVGVMGKVDETGYAAHIICLTFASSL
jgi:hypothetical protein